MLIKPTSQLPHTFRQWRLPSDSRVPVVMAAYGVYPSANPDSIDWDFEADGQPCCIWQMGRSETYGAYAPREVLEWLGFAPFK